MSSANAARNRRRSGVALVSALGMLLLASALLAGSAAASVELGRATRSRTAAARAESEAMRSLGMVVRTWRMSADSLAVGGTRDITLPISATGGPSVLVTARLWRVAEWSYAAVVTVRVGAAERPLARRRVRLLLERRAQVDSVGILPDVVPLRRWAVTHLQ